MGLDVLRERPTFSGQVQKLESRDRATFLVPEADLTRERQMNGLTEQSPTRRPVLNAEFKAKDNKRRRPPDKAWGKWGPWGDRIEGMIEWLTIMFVVLLGVVLAVALTQWIWALIGGGLAVVAAFFNKVLHIKFFMPVIKTLWRQIFGRLVKGFMGWWKKHEEKRKAKRARKSSKTTVFGAEVVA